MQHNVAQSRPKPTIGYAFWNDSIGVQLGQLGRKVPSVSGAIVYEHWLQLPLQMVTIRQAISITYTQSCKCTLRVVFQRLLAVGFIWNFVVIEQAYFPKAR